MLRLIEPSSVTFWAFLRWMRGQGWLILALPPAEIAFHPAAGNDKHEIYLLCDDIAVTVQSLEKQKVNCDPVTELGWGLLTHLSLPGVGRLGLYQPKHRMAARMDGATLAPGRPHEPL
jgi:hypothetical protein